MDSPKKDKRLHAIATNWSNNSHSSINTTSDTATFHSANDNHSHNMELHSLKTQFPFMEQHILPISHITKDIRKESIPEVPSLVNSISSSRRTSTTSTSTSRRTSPSKSRRRTYQGTTTSTYNTRPVTKRASRSSPQTTSSFHCSRPHLSARHTIPYLPSTPPQTANQFFHFPSLPTPEVSPNSKSIPQVQPQPPPTIQYWTSDNTRRLEYAAIDAASRGLRGFLNKLIPDCMLPKDMRQTRFCEGDKDSDAGSVRRYRLDLPGEDDLKHTEKDGKRSGVFRRWSGGFRSSTA